MFAWYALLFQSALNLWNVFNLWSAFSLRYAEYDICVACVNFPNLGDQGLELFILILLLKNNLLVIINPGGSHQTATIHYIIHLVGNKDLS